ncbi:MAG: hypothetical protein L0228_16095, partial [Planctomycetes bacterium]|nr:hypothetical protein [Planctomycetota bacterium]
ALLFALPGCSEKPAGIPHTHHEEFEVTLCGLCGDVKEGEHTCKAGAEICRICGLHKGAILCCSTAINGRRDVILCRKCGEKLLTKKCCQEGIAICPKCGLQKNSPGCCKIEKAVDDGTGHAKEAGHAGEAG